MKKAKARWYDAHKDYDVYIDAELLNMRIRIYGEEAEETGVIDYEGNIGTFLKERLPAEWLVELLPQLKDHDRISYKGQGSKNYIERIR